MALCLCSFSVFAEPSKTELPAWARENSRTQGGGWVWFPGKAVARSEADADFHARGMALDYLVQECTSIPKETQFNERFSIRKRGFYYVYVRASVKNTACKFLKSKEEGKRKKYLNEELKVLYGQYKLNEAKKRFRREFNFRECHNRNDYCLDRYFTYANMHDDYLAILYAQHSCDKGVQRACKYATEWIKFVSEN